MNSHGLKFSTAVTFLLGAVAMATASHSAFAQATGDGNIPTTGPVLPAPILTNPVSSIPPAALKQIQLMMADKATWTVTEQKMDSHLIHAARALQGKTPVAGITSLPINITLDTKNRVRVNVEGHVTNLLVDAIKAVGGTVLTSYPEGDVVDAQIPLLGLATLAARSDVRFIEPVSGYMLNKASGGVTRQPGIHPLVPYSISPARRAKLRQQVVNALTTAGLLPRMPNLPLMPLLLQTGNFESEGDVTHQATVARSTYGITGAGIKIGVLSDGDANLASAQSTGDLPANVTIVPGQAGPSGNEGEGTAMMEIVYDLAPGASLYFATADNGESQFATNIKTLRSTYGCDIIVDDVYYLDEPPFQDGTVALAVNTVTAAGGLYYSSAGNQGHVDTTGDNFSFPAYNPAYTTSVSASVWEGDFTNDGTTITSPTLSSGKTITGFVHQYGAAKVAYNTVTSDGINANDRTYLFWSDPLGASGNDYDMYVLKSNGTVDGYGNNKQTGTGNPVESAVTSAAGDQIYIVKNSGAATRALHLNTFGDGYQPGLSFYTNGQTHGHSSAADAFSVAAAPATNNTNFYPSPGAGGPYPNPFTTSSKLEVFTSDGPRRIFYNADGSAVISGNYLFSTNGGTVRQKPDITAADGVTTSQSGFDPFYGTSAAAPHAAAIAGLIKSYSVSSNGLTILGTKLVSADMHTIMQSTALDIGTAGVDTTTGYGIIMPIPEIQFLQAFLSSSVTSTPADTTATIGWTTNLPANTVVNYGPTQSLGSTYTSSTATTSHLAPLTGLSPNTTYFYKISSTTASGAVSYTDTSTRTFVTTSTTQPNLALGTVTAANSGSITTVQIPIVNNGGASSDVQVTVASLGGGNTTTTLPLDLGALGAGATKTATLVFPQIASGTRTVLRVTVTDGTGAVNNFSLRVTVP